MEILFLGGTQFVGRHLVEAALERGHTATLFHRGKTGTDLFPEVARVIGDRDGGLAALTDQTFDAVVDVCGYLPRLVRDSVEQLRAAVDRYLFISTISVYADSETPGQTEDAPLVQIDDPTTETVDAKTYGGLKVLCEEAVSEGFGGRSLILRPGFVVGPADHTDRFTYWLRRLATGGTFLAPGDPDDAMQWVDVRDLARFAIDGLERDLGGVFTVTGPATRLTWGVFFESVESCFGAGAVPTWIPEAFLEEQKAIGAELPMALPTSHKGWMAMVIDRALGAGLTHRSWEETFRDTLDWDREHGLKGPGMSAEREALVLAAWRESTETAD